MKTKQHALRVFIQAEEMDEGYDLVSIQAHAERLIGVVEEYSGAYRHLRSLGQTIERLFADDYLNDLVTFPEEWPYTEDLAPTAGTKRIIEQLKQIAEACAELLEERTDQ